MRARQLPHESTSERGEQHAFRYDEPLARTSIVGDHEPTTSFAKHALESSHAGDAQAVVDWIRLGAQREDGVLKSLLAEIDEHEGPGLPAGLEASLVSRTTSP